MSQLTLCLQCGRMGVPDYKNNCCVSCANPGPLSAQWRYDLKEQKELIKELLAVIEEIKPYVASDTYGVEREEKLIADVLQKARELGY